MHEFMQRIDSSSDEHVDADEKGEDVPAEPGFRFSETLRLLKRCWRHAAVVYAGLHLCVAAATNFER